MPGQRYTPRERNTISWGAPRAPVLNIRSKARACKPYKTASDFFIFKACEVTEGDKFRFACEPIFVQQTMILYCIVFAPDPCVNACEKNAAYEILNHAPMCSCQKGYEGDPFLKCFKDKTRQYSMVSWCFSRKPLSIRGTVGSCVCLSEPMSLSGVG